jgi:hypothetical protein
MNAKANSIRIVPAIIVNGRTQEFDDPIPSVVLPRAVRCELAAPSGRPCLRLALRSPDDRAGEFWEALSWLAIWSCGFIGIGLSFH